MKFTGNNSVKSILVYVVVLILSVQTYAETETPPMELSCILPVGQPDAIKVTWKYADSETVNLQLFRIYEGDSLQFIPGIDFSGYEFIDQIKADSKPLGYKLVASENDTVSSAIQAMVPRLSTGGFIHFTAGDVPYDAGEAVSVEWKCTENVPLSGSVEIFSSSDGGETWTKTGEASVADTTFMIDDLEDGQPFSYLARVHDAGVIYESSPVHNVSSQASWFDSRKINLLMIAIVILAAIILYVIKSSRGDSMFIRKIAGLNAVEEAVGRATEMGRSVLFVPGIQDLDDVQTIAGLNILGSVAKLTAEYETGLDVPVARSLVMSNGREIVKESYLSVGRPDFYNDDIVHYVTDEQFGYVAAVDGIMVREKPAACFYMGAFFAESLILAETGNSVGAIQIAGTAMPSQLPFFVAACDYTLIGEELFAASAYLSGDQRVIGSLRGQDIGKALSMLSILGGSILMTMASLTGSGIEGAEPGFWAKLADGFVRLFALNF